MEIDLTKLDRGAFMVNLVGIIYNPKTKKILIGKRENDEHVPELSWAFPGGRPAYNKDLEDSLKQEIKKKTGLDADVREVILARITPEIENQIIIYYYCEAEGKGKVGDKFKEIKWINPKEYLSYFKTSIHPKIIKLLENLK